MNSLYRGGLGQGEDKQRIPGPGTRPEAAVVIGHYPAGRMLNRHDSPGTCVNRQVLVAAEGFLIPPAGRDYVSPAYGQGSDIQRFSIRKDGSVTSREIPGLFSSETPGV